MLGAILALCLCCSHVRKLMNDEQGAKDVLSIPSKVAHHMGGVGQTTREAADSVQRLTLCARAFCMGPKMLCSTAEDRFTPVLNSLLATPLFHKSSQFSSVLFKETLQGREIFKLGEVRVLFSVPHNKTAANQQAAVQARLAPPPIKYALVRIYDRHKLTVAAGVPVGVMRAHAKDYGDRLQAWKPTEDEDRAPTGCMQLRRLPSWGTLVIPLSWVVQTVHVVEDFAAGEPDRFLLNRWFWRS